MYSTLAIRVLMPTLNEELNVYSYSGRPTNLGQPARLRRSDKYITRYPAQLKRHANDFQHRRYSRHQR